MTTTPELRLLSSCPETGGGVSTDDFDRVRETATWAEDAGHQALLLPSANHLADPWSLAQLVLHETESIRPVVTVHPGTSNPYAVAKRVATLALLYGRTPHLNLAAGAYRSDLLSLGDRTPHDARYARLIEFGSVIRSLLESEDPVVFDGEFYQLHKPAALPPLAPQQQPDFFVCAASETGTEAARMLGATTVHQLTSRDDEPAPCIRLGVIARHTDDEAWEVARERFPANHAARFHRRLEMALTDSRAQAELAEAASEEGDELWMTPFENRQAPCAYVVGSHGEVSRRVRRWLDAGTFSFLLDAPASPEDLEHTGEVFARAWRRFQSPLAVSV